MGHASVYPLTLRSKESGVFNIHLCPPLTEDPRIHGLPKCALRKLAGGKLGDLQEVINMPWGGGCQGHEGRSMNYGPRITES